MDLREMVAPESVALGVAAAGKRAVLDRAAALLAGRAGIGAGIGTDVLADALVARERLGTTGFGGGTAIPHGRVAGLGHPCGAILLLADPIDWEAVDGAPVDLVFALASPDAADARHLIALARVSRTLRDAAFVARLRGASDPGALWALLAGDDGRRAA